MNITKLFSILFLVAFSFGIQQSANAQIIDSLPYFKKDLLLDIEGKFDIGGTFMIPMSSQKQIKSIRISASKKTKAAPNIRVINGPIVLRRGQKCYKFSCVPTKNCNNCKMYWWDRNGDKRIQPRQELRCGCSGVNNQCKMRVELVDCPK